MELEIIKNFLLENFWIGNLTVFIAVILANTFPIMFFVYPYLIIFLGVFLSKNFGDWYITYFLLLIGSILGESISYFFGYKYGDKLIKNKLFKNDKSQKILNKILNNKFKTIFFGKITPGIFGIIPIFCGILKINFTFFFFTNLLISILAVSYIFGFLYFGIEIFEKYFGENIMYIIIYIIIIYLIYLFFKNRKEIIKNIKNINKK
ncbi:VTT domain-containing protein [Candidatus Vampirococcus lugosii]|uniref:VTT domain-containing protein n=1 Tax=Candidatus Vampirococcus lugosii TaxID=2789015 RepID=A0ABS5QLL4_9BACT|nr:VTT domain-containing protein [Candidatus Vampirococcus lugosii]MBS8122087.1 hypothetical protein [Candidatus Vampirococcus lugosii]